MEIEAEEAVLATAIVEDPMRNGSRTRLDGGQRVAPKVTEVTARAHVQTR
jgi:hypothetical protein